MVNIKQLSLDELHNYDELTAPIARFVSILWRTADFKPHKLAEVQKQLADGTLTEEEISKVIDDILSVADGASNETDTLISWAEALTVFRVANEMEIWKSTPLQVLIGAVFTFGMNVADEINRRKLPPETKAGSNAANT